MAKRKTHEEFVEQLKKMYGNEYEILGEYLNDRTKILVRHNKCGYEWRITPSNLLRRHGCPVCAENKKKTTEDFKKEIYNIYGDEYEVLGKYINNHTKILVKHNCKKCNYNKYEVKPNGLLQGNGCPVCSNQKAALGINTIWDTDRWMCDLGVSEEDAKKHSSRSGKKITVKCLDCGREKRIAIYQIYNNKSISCSCGDGKSYPEKFVMNVLEQLDVDFETEYSPDWIKPKRYDFYISSLNCVVETHGEQHYNDKFTIYNKSRLIKQQQNDKFKKEMALQNGVKYYIEIDCRESNIEWIKNSILDSKLSELFDLSKIDWLQCVEFANKNIVKEICDYWNNKQEDETTSDLGRMFNLNGHTVNRYLKRGIKLGWCSYDPKEEMRKIRSKVGGHNKKKVEIFKNEQSLGIFSSCAELERQSEELFGIRLTQVGISRVCRGERTQYKGFTFKYIEEDNNLNISKIA